MKKIICWALFLCLAQISLAQKKTLDSLALASWSSIEANPIMSSQGTYLVYFRDYKPYDIHYTGNQVFVKKIAGGPAIEINAVKNEIFFSDNERYLYYRSRSGSLKLLDLYSGHIDSVQSVSRFSVQANRLFYTLKGLPETLYIKDGQKTVQYNHIENYWASSGENHAFIFQLTANGKQLIELGSGPAQNKKKWEGDELEDFTFDPHLKRHYFKGEIHGKSAFYFFSSGEKIKKVPVYLSEDLDLNYRLGNITGFTPDGMKILIALVERNPGTKQTPSNPLLDIWTYKDIRLKTFHSPRGGETNPPTVLVDMLTGKATLLTGPFDEVISLSNFHARLSTREGDGYLQEADWNRYSWSNMVNFRFASSKRIPEETQFCSLSPSGNVELSFDERDWKLRLSMLSSGLTKSIQKIAIGKQINSRSGKEMPPVSVFLEVRWSRSEDWVLISDGADIWKVGVSAKSEPICLTNGYAKKNRITFRFLDRAENFNENGLVYLSAENRQTMESAFYVLNLNTAMDPMQSFSAAAKYHLISNNHQNYLFQVSRADESVYYALTRDFKTFHQVKDLRPEADYNWLTSELHHYKISGGKASKGILYKPVEFNPAKKYPLIISVYQDLVAQQLHDFPGHAGFVGGPLNIPWMVSRGYLVFVPDVPGAYNRNGASALNYITGAKQYVRDLPFVDPQKIGLAGHSFGGYETLYMISHGQDFAAAYAGSPMDELITAYETNPGMFHNGQFAIGPTLWEDPRPYFDNSAYYQAHKVSTPLLLMGNRGDFLWPQAPMFFKAMRRLGKPCWMLEYKKGGHTVLDESALDLTRRIQQFFDHYLKGRPAPDWMDTAKGQLLIPQAQQAADSLKRSPPISVTFR